MAGQDMVHTRFITDIHHLVESRAAWSSRFETRRATGYLELRNAGQGRGKMPDQSNHVPLRGARAMTTDSGLVRDIYAAALGDRPWQDVIGRSAALMGASGSFLFTTYQRESDGGLCVSHGLPEPVVRQFLTEVSTVDLWYQALLRRHGTLKTGFAWQTDGLVPEQEMRRSRMFADYLVPCDIGRNLGVVLNDGLTPGQPLTALCFYRPVRSDPFSQEQRVPLNEIAPHFIEAMEVRHRLGVAVQNPAALALERLSMPVVVLAVDRQILLSNPAADSLFADARLRLVVQGRLRAQEAALNAALEQAIHACSTYRFDARLSRSVRLWGPVGQGVVARLAPPPPSTPRGSRAAAVAFLFREGRSATDVRSLMRSLYQLSTAELDLVDALCAGLTPETVAQQRAVGVATVRTQLRSIFGKTGARRQSDLMRLVFSIAH